AVVAGGVGPGLVADPAPAPRLDPGPVAVAVGTPSCFDPRLPGPVAVDELPLAVSIQLVGAGHVLGDVRDGRDAAHLVLAIEIPAVEGIATLGVEGGALDLAALRAEGLSLGDRLGGLVV